MGETDNSSILQRLDGLDGDSKRNSDQHREFYTELEKLRTKQAVGDEKLAQILQSLTKIEAKVEEINSKPLKRWDTLITSIITAIIGCVVGGVISTLF